VLFRLPRLLLLSSQMRRGKSCRMEDGQMGSLNARRTLARFKVRISRESGDTGTGESDTT
jgi:hypothetical protein